MEERKDVGKALSDTEQKALLDGLTLERVATMPDEIKGWRCANAPDQTTRIEREHTTVGNEHDVMLGEF